MSARLSVRAGLYHALRRKLVVVPLVAVLLVALVTAAFVGYGAYTRSKPVHYARGGQQFAALPSPTATVSMAPSGAPSSTETAAPSTTAAPTTAPSTSGAPSVLPRTDGSPATEAPGATAPTVRGAQVAVPRTGRYGLKVQGSEKVDFGPVSFCSQALPSSTDLVVSKAQGESPTSYDFDLPYFPGQTGKHDERHLYRYTDKAVFLDYEIATVTCQGVRQSSDTDYTPPQTRVQLPLAVGKSWKNVGGDSDRTETSTSKVTRTETLTVQGRSVTTWVIETSTTFTGSESGSRTQTWWYAPTWAMPLKWYEHIDGRRSGAAYSEDVTVSVVRAP